MDDKHIARALNLKDSELRPEERETVRLVRKYVSYQRAREMRDAILGDDRTPQWVDAVRFSARFVRGDLREQLVQLAKPTQGEQLAQREQPAIRIVFSRGQLSVTDMSPTAHHRELWDLYAHGLPFGSPVMNFVGHVDEIHTDCAIRDWVPHTANWDDEPWAVWAIVAYFWRYVVGIRGRNIIAPDIHAVAHNVELGTPFQWTGYPIRADYLRALRECARGRMIVQSWSAHVRSVPDMAIERSKHIASLI